MWLFMDLAMLKRMAPLARIFADQRQIDRIRHEVGSKRPFAALGSK
jgi:hypothetical protein